MEAAQSHKPAPRIPLHLDVEFRKSYARQSTKGVLKNISLSGAFLHDPRTEFQNGEKVNLEFKVSGRNRNIQATVVWSNEYGAGVVFHHGNNRDQQIIDDLMYFISSKKSSSRSILDSIFTRSQYEEEE